jgi:hypothetical protein
MVICTCGLLSYPAKVPKFHYTAWWYSIDQEFQVDVEKTHVPNFEPLRSLGFNGHDLAKVSKFKYKHDGALSIRNFAQAQLINSHTCQLTYNQKLCFLLPWYIEFPIYFCLSLYLQWYLLWNAKTVFSTKLEFLSLKEVAELGIPFILFFGQLPCGGFIAETCSRGTTAMNQLLIFLETQKTFMNSFLWKAQNNKASTQKLILTVASSTRKNLISSPLSTILQKLGNFSSTCAPPPPK